MAPTAKWQMLFLVISVSYDSLALGADHHQPIRIPGNPVANHNDFLDAASDSLHKKPRPPLRHRHWNPHKKDPPYSSTIHDHEVKGHYDRLSGQDEREASQPGRILGHHAMVTGEGSPGDLAVSGKEFRRHRRSLEKEQEENPVHDDFYYDVLPVDYDATSRPMGKAGEPVKVEIGVWILDIQKISEHDMDLTIEMELLMTWTDERLVPPANITDDEDFVSLHPSLAKKLWIPDIYFGHIRYMYAPRVFADAQEIWLHKNKSVGISKLLIVKTGCHMNFALYPMDIQRCLLSIESYGYTVDEMAYEWATWAGKVKVLGETTLEQFSYSAIVTNLTSKVYGGDTYPRLGVEIVLERKLAYHLLQTYLPGSLFVMMSWFSFAVPPLIVPGRVVLCVTTILTLTSMFSTARTSTPQVSYIKALDVFMITSIIFVFLTLLEYTFLLRKRRQHLLEAAIKERTRSQRRWTSRKVKPNPQETGVEDGVKFIKVSSHPPPSPSPPPPSSASKEDTHAKDPQGESYEEYCARIDRRAVVVMPALFVAFNLVYWPYYAGQRN